MSRDLNVWYKDLLVGRLLDSGAGRMAFIYDGDWLSHGWAISCSLPLDETGDFLPPDLRGHHFFANLLPEGNARDRLVRQMAVADDDLSLLERLGGDCAGALQLLPSHQSPATEGAPKTSRALKESTLIAAIEQGRSAWLDGDTAPRLSLAGAQDKIPVCATPTKDGGWRFDLPENNTPSTHILKLPIRDLRQVPLLEIYTTYVAAQLGLPVAPVKLVRIGEHIASLAKRYDRDVQPGWVRRLHQEDFCQAQGLSHRQKYDINDGGFAPLATIIKDHCRQPATDLQALAQWQIFNALAGNADGHIKNLSLLSDGAGVWKLAPFYDLVCTLAIGQVSHQLALPVGEQTDPGNLHHTHWQAFAKQLGMAPKRIQRLINIQVTHLETHLDDLHQAFIEQHRLGHELDKAKAVIQQQVKRARLNWLA